MSVWEGSGNVQALDVLRALGRSPDALDAVLGEIALAAGANPLLDTELDGAASGVRPTPPTRAARACSPAASPVRIQASLLVRHAPHAVADAFCATRLGPTAGRTFGELPPGRRRRDDRRARGAGRRAVKVVAIQPDVAIGDVERNLAHLEDLIRQAAREHEPDAIFLPESMTSKNVYDRRMRTVARPLDGSPLIMLQRMAREFDCVDRRRVHRDSRRRHPRHLRGRRARRDGAVPRQGPAVVLGEQLLLGRQDDGVMDTSLGPVGIANGFEWGRTRTARRMLGRVRLLAGGMHFPSFPSWRLTKPWFWDRDHQALLQYARETPPRMARLLGVPAVHPSHVGALHDGDDDGPGPAVAVDLRRRDRRSATPTGSCCSACRTRTAKAGSAPTSTRPPSRARGIRCHPASGTRCSRSRSTPCGTSATCTAA